jgi:hypothetical protein
MRRERAPGKARRFTYNVNRDLEARFGERRVRLVWRPD